MTKYEKNVSKFFDLPDFEDIGWVDLVKEAKKNAIKVLENELDETKNFDLNKISLSEARLTMFKSPVLLLIKESVPL